MAVAVVFCLACLCVGYGGVRVLGVAKGALSLGLAPAAGAALLTALASGCVLLGSPPPLAGVVCGLAVLAGLGLVVRDRGELWLALRSLARAQRWAVATLVLALLVPIVVMGIAFAGVSVPLSPHDGAFHTEVVQVDRLGQGWASWYPPGLGALFAAPLQVLPWIDSAQGSLELGESLPLLGVLAVFGLGVAVWRNLLVAALGALFLSLTYLYPYFPQIWSGWPLALSLVLVCGLWIVGLEYPRQPSWRWAALAGLLAGAVVLVHGTELYTAALVLLVLGLAAWRSLAWRRLAWHLLLGLGVATVVAAPYLPTLLHWAAAGGAYTAGLADSQVLATPGGGAIGGVRMAEDALQALGIDAPVRVVLLVLGAVACLRQRTGRSVLLIGLGFALLDGMFTFLSGVGVVRQAFAAVFPWGEGYRLLMIAALAAVLLAAFGAVWGAAALGGWLAAREAGRPRTVRRVRRAGKVLVGTWLVLAVGGLAAYVSIPAALVVGYSAEDAAAMAWLRSHAAPDALVANDGGADAGIWVPYKAGLPIVMPYAVVDPNTAAERQLVLDNLDWLDQVPAARQAACELHVQYVYDGARVSGWDKRHFPDPQQLAQTGWLEPVFSSGGASIFRIRPVLCQ